MITILRIDVGNGRNPLPPKAIGIFSSHVAALEVLLDEGNADIFGVRHLRTIMGPMASRGTLAAKSNTRHASFEFHIIGLDESLQ
jgi:hypothetical protein